MFATECTMAQVTEVNRFNASNYDYPIPQEFTVDGKSKLILYEENRDTYSMSIYDEKFEAVKNFTYTGKTWEQVSEISERYRNTEYIYDENTGEYLGKKYVYSDWSTPNVHTSEYYESPFGCQFEDYNIANYGSSVILTQKLFNDDDTYEFIVPIYKQIEYDESSDRYGDGVISYREKGKAVVKTGFKIISDEGNEVASVYFDEDMTASYGGHEAYINKIGDNYYLKMYVTSYKDRDNYEKGNYIIYYAINRETSSIQLVKKSVMRCSPTMPRAGEVVDVTLDENNDAQALNVTSVSGKLVKSISIKPNQTNVSISTAGFASGMYIVSIANGKSSKECCKIVIR